MNVELSLEDIEKQIDFIIEADKLKHVFRQTPLIKDGRAENDAEHSWHLSLMAVLLFRYAGEEVDLLRVLKMLLIHDIVEIDAGDTFFYDEVSYKDKDVREQKAADRLFNILPDEQALEFRKLWDEFEGRKTEDARYAAALDRFQPILLNFHTHGLAWRRHGMTRDQVISRNIHISEGSPELWKYAIKLIDEAVEKGFLKS